ncbi:hypothetical protein [Luteimonas suaedae]|uniref:hypothetical protein n=1 Tax=Luteimonas suaedae TaxID=2605430 RepID=UPI0011EC62DA|nr:hypothetical protein [Luteimonas suaedae]
MSGFRDDTPPWSFFVPIALAVIVGVLAADAIRYAVVTVFAGHDAPIAETTPRDAAESDDSPIAANGEALPGPDLDAADQDAASSPRAEPVNATQPPEAAAGVGPGEAEADSAQVPASSALQELPGPLSARRDGDNATCINGTVAYRSGNGWEQSLENDAPIRCTATSP